MRSFRAKNSGLKTAAIFSLLGLFLFVSPLFGQTNDYETIARNFLLFLGSDKPIVSSELIRSNDLAPDQPELEIAYLAKLDRGGYILVSTSRTISPVKAYSLTGDFDTLPTPYRRYLLLEAEARVRNAGTTGKSPLALSETEKSWEFLLNFTPSARMPLDYTPDTFLLTTRWNQDAPYNKFLPEIDGKHVLAGCVNIAMGQVMKYHGYPAAGQGIATSTWNGSELEAILYRPYNWTNMPDAATLTESEYKADEVALLIRDLGVMNGTDFGLAESSASANLQGLAEHFGYSRDILDIENTPDKDLFFDTLRGEIDNLRPVLLEFPGHMTVADGYSSDATGKTIHVNMGWGGNYDDYYYLDDTIAIEQGPSFNPELTIHYNIKPCEGDECVSNLEPADQIEGLTITGAFDYATDIDRFNVYLKGATTISGSRGYGNQAFYISIYDTDRHLVKSDDEQLTLDNLQSGLYKVSISLMDALGTENYLLAEGYNNYTVNITTTELTAEEKAQVDAGLDVAPVIGNTFMDRLFDSSAPVVPYRILIDARDANGDTVSLEASSTNTAAITAQMEGNILVLTPVQDAVKTASKITVTATANGKETEKSFIAMVDNRTVAFGKSFTVSGIFENQEDSNLHQVILDGNCTISGYNGYSDQEFYSSVSDSSETVISPSDNKPISSSFPFGMYTIRASLQQNPGDYGYYYNYENTNHEYQLAVSCFDATDQTATIAEILGIDLSQTVEKPYGDLDGNLLVNLADAIIGLQVLAGMNPDVLRDDFVTSGTDVNGTGQIGLQDVIYILQKLSALR